MFPFENNVHTLNLLERHYMAYLYIKIHTSELNMVSIISSCLYFRTHIKISEALVLQMPIGYVL